MKALFHRLLLAYRLVRAPRFVLYLPAYPAMELAVGGTVGPATWEAIVCFSIAAHNAAQDEAEARLLADLEAQRVADLEAEIAAVLHQP